MFYMQRKRKTELLKISNSFKRTASEKETRLEAVLALKKMFRWQKKIFHRIVYEKYWY